MSQTCIDRLKVLADTTRLSVLEALLEGPKRVADLMELLNVEQTLLSHHLKVLRDAGLVEATREGKAKLYRLAKNVEGSVSGQSIHLGCCQLSFESGDQRGGV